ncbi:MAG: Crp/Fnr family transcriptional regulator [Burkholderiales bacterium]
MPVEAGRQCRGKLWSNLKEVCDLLHIPFNVSLAYTELLFQHVQFRPGQRIHTAGQKFVSLCIVNSGFLKTASIDELGHEQVHHFPMKGDVLGVECICTKRYSSETVALSDCNIIFLPFQKLAALGHAHVEFENAIYSLLSRELIRKQAMVNMLSAFNAETRVARFLVSLSERYAEIGYSKTMFNLQMTRQEIGSYLGLSLETVSRTLSALNEIGLISVDQRAIWIKHLDKLKMLRRLPVSTLHARQVKSGKLQVGANWSHAVPGSLVN